MIHLNQDCRIHEFKYEDRQYRAVYSWALNSIWIDIKTPSGWTQIDANTQEAFDMIRQEQIEWGDHREYRESATIASGI